MDNSDRGLLCELQDTLSILLLIQLNHRFCLYHNSKQQQAQPKKQIRSQKPQRKEKTKPARVNRQVSTEKSHRLLREFTQSTSKAKRIKSLGKLARPR